MKWFKFIPLLLLPSLAFSSGIYNPGGNGGGGGTTILPLPGGATNYIQNRSTLQAGATAFPDFIYVGTSETIKGPGGLGVIFGIVASTISTLDTVIATSGDPLGTSFETLSNPTSASTAQVYANSIEAGWISSVPSPAGGIYATNPASIYLGSTTLSNVAGTQSQGFNEGGGSVKSVFGSSSLGATNLASFTTNQYGLEAQTESIGGSTVTNNYTMYISSPFTDFSGKDVISNNFGLYIDSQTAGQLNYGIYQVSGQNFFGGTSNFNLGVKTSTLTVSASAGGGVQCAQLDNNGTLTGTGSACGSGGGGTPSGAFGQFQYNNSGSFGGVNGFFVGASSITISTPTYFNNPVDVSNLSGAHNAAPSTPIFDAWTDTNNGIIADFGSNNQSNQFVFQDGAALDIREGVFGGDIGVGIIGIGNADKIVDGNTQFNALNLWSSVFGDDMTTCPSCGPIRFLPGLSAITFQLDPSTSTFHTPVTNDSVAEASLPTGYSNGTEMYCSDCKNGTDDGIAWDSNVVAGGHGTMVKFENGNWRVE